MPYVYHLYFKPLDLHYYGVRHKKGCKPEDLWTKYFSSSEEVKRLIKIYGKEAFVPTIRKVFETKEAAIEWEHRFLKKINACKNEKWINKHSRKNDIMLNPETVEKVHSKLRSLDQYRKLGIMVSHKRREENFDFGSISRKEYVITFNDNTQIEVKDLKSFAEEIGCGYAMLRQCVSKTIPYRKFNIRSVVLKDGFEPSLSDSQSNVLAITLQ